MQHLDFMHKLHQITKISTRFQHTSKHPSQNEPVRAGQQMRSRQRLIIEGTSLEIPRFELILQYDPNHHAAYGLPTPWMT
jgi:hypothetical protein